MAGRCDCDKACGCAQIGTDSVQVLGNGGPTAPFKPGLKLRPGGDNLIVIFTSADGMPGVAAYMRVTAADGTTVLVPDPATGFIRIPPAWLRDAGGTELVPGDDGSVTLPAASTPVYGPGLTVVAGALVPTVADADSSQWPGNALDGNPFSGDPADLPNLFRGTAIGLRSRPEHTTIRGGGGEVLVASTLTAVPSSYTSPAGTVWSVTNPSSHRRMIVNRNMAVVVQLSSGVNSNAAVQLQSRVNGGAWGGVRTLHWPFPTSSGAAIQFEGEVTKDAGSVINPGASHSVQVRAVVTKEGAGADPVVLSVSAAVELLGTTI